MAFRRAEERVELKEILAKKVYTLIGERSTLLICSRSRGSIFSMSSRASAPSPALAMRARRSTSALAVDGRVEEFFQDVVLLALDEVENCSGDRRLVLELLLEGPALKVESWGGARPFDCVRPEARVKRLACPSQLVISSANRIGAHRESRIWSIKSRVIVALQVCGSRRSKGGSFSEIFLRTMLSKVRILPPAIMPGLISKASWPSSDLVSTTA